MGLDKDLGTVEVGKLADLLVVKGDPFSDMSTLRQDHWAVTRGRIFGTNVFR